MTQQPPADIAEISAAHGGILYPGELVRAERWRPGLGAPLLADAYFRVVFLDVEPRAPVEIADARIAVVVPGQATRSQQRMAADLRTLREAQATYAVAPGGLEATESQARALEERLVSEWAASYQRGHVMAEPPLEIDGRVVFADGYWSAWTERVGARLLARAYPRLPVDAHLLQAPLRPDLDAPVLFDAVNGGAGVTLDLALKTLGPALGLTSTAAPTTLDLGASQAVALAEAECDTSADAATVGHRLAHVHGLTYPLATLVALLLVARGRHEVELRRGHGLRLRDGGALQQDHITPFTASALAWPRTFWQVAATVRRARSGALVRYLRALEPTAATEQIPADQQRAQAHAWLDAVSARLPHVSRTLTSLARAQGRERGGDEARRIAQLRELTDMPADGRFEDAVERVFGGHDGFAAAMELWRGWEQALDVEPALEQALRFLGRAVVPEERADLFMERQALIQRLADERLALAPHQWEGLVQAVRVFRGRYATAYLAHHDAYHTRMDLLSQQLADASRLASALARLNEITELGPAVSPQLPALVEESYNTVRACGARPSPLEIELEARCGACGVELGAEPPEATTAQLSGYVRQALTHQQDRLARWAAHRALSRDERARLDLFMDLLRVSDVSGLVNVLDDRVADFVREMVREPDRDRPS